MATAIGKNVRPIAVRKDGRMTFKDRVEARV
jgi:hypothetical protein